MIPATLVAMCGDEPIGFICLILDNLPTRPDLNPWLASLFVREEFRDRGVGKVLVKECRKRVGATGFGRLHLFTTSAVEYYRKRGWRVLCEQEIFRKPSTVLCIDLSQDQMDNFAKF